MTHALRVIPINRTELGLAELVEALARGCANQFSLREMWEQSCRDYLETEARLTLAGSARRLLELVVNERLAGAGTRRVLVPAFHCPTIAAAIDAAGGLPEPVDVDPLTGLPDPTAVRRALARRAALVVVAPLFGAMTGLEAVLSECRRHEVPALADCAQAFVPGIEARLPGCAAYIFSFAAGKHLPLFAGGLLAEPGAARAPARRRPDRAQPAPVDEARVILRAMAYSVLWRARSFGPLVRSAAKESRHSREPSPRAFPASSAALGIRLIRRLPADSRRRLENEQAYCDALTTRSLTSRFVPLAIARTAATRHAVPPLLRFPLLCRSREVRDRLVCRLWRQGVWSSATDYAARLPGSGYGGAREVADRLLTLPLHAGVRPCDIAAIVAGLEREDNL